MVTRLRSLIGGVGLVVVTLALSAGPAFAQIPDPAPDPTMPGAGLVTQIIGWLKWGSLAAAVAGIFGGGISIAIGHWFGQYGASAGGRKAVLGGLAAAAVAGLAHTFVTTVYNAT